MSTFQDALSGVKSETVNNIDPDADWLQENVCKYISNCLSVCLMDIINHLIKLFLYCRFRNNNKASYSKVYF